MTLRSLAVSLERFGTATDADLTFSALLAARAGHCELVLRDEALQRATFHWALDEGVIDPQLLLARCALSAGDDHVAFGWLLRVLDRRPGELEVLAGLVAGARSRLALADGRLPRWEAELLALHDATSAQVALGRAFLEWREAGLARDQFDLALAHFPDLAVVVHDRARALASLGDEAGALAGYAEALRLFPDHPFSTHPFDVAMAHALGERPDDPGVLSLGAEHALRQGRLGEARELTGRAVQGAHAPAPDDLARLTWLGSAKE